MLRSRNLIHTSSLMTPSILTRSKKTRRPMIASEPFKRDDTHTVTLKSGQHMRIDSAITGSWGKGASQTANHLACTRKLSSEFGTYFASTDPSHIRFNQDPDGKLCYSIDQKLIKDRLQAAFKCSSIDTVRLVCPHEKRAIDIEVLTKDGVHFESTVELAYQEPRDGWTDADRAAIDRALEESAARWRDVMEQGSYSEMARCPIETPFKITEPMTSSLFALDRALIKTAECDIRARFARDLEFKIRSKQPFGWMALGLGGLYGLAANRYASHRALKTIIRDINHDLQALETAYSSYRTDKWMFIAVCIVFAVVALNTASMVLKGAGIWDHDRHEKLNVELIILAATVICGLPIGFVTLCFCTAVPGANNPMA